jgi:hypothetical protein
MAARLLADRYALEEKPRHGGTAAVYKAADMAAGMKPVAVKVFESRLKNERFLREYFNRELAALEGIRHQNVVSLIDWGTDDGEGNPYVVLEWADDDLLDLIQRRPFEGWDDFAPVALGVLQGLEAIQTRGYVHRDIKPENVLMTENGVPKVADLGISKVAERLNMGLTLSGQGTPPYTPAEEDDGKHSFSRDVFAFGVLVIRVLSNELLQTYEDVQLGLERLDLHPTVSDFLLRAIAKDPSTRPQTAAQALGELEKFQRTREAKWHKIYLSMAENVRTVISATLEIDRDEVASFILDDLAEASSFELAPPGKDKAGVYRDSDFLVAGSTFSYRMRRDDRSAGLLAVIGASRLPPSLLESYRERALRPPVTFLPAPALDAVAAQQAIEELLVAVAEHSAERAVADAEERERELFRVWHSILNAKKDVESSRGEPIRYRSFRVAGRRVFFDAAGDPSPELIGQPRMVRVGHRRDVAGEVEDVVGSEVVLFVERGNPGDLRQSGELIYDSEASRIAIDRQRAALEAVRYGRSARSDLGDLLIRPSSSTPPRPADDVDFRYPDLDESKQIAVRAALGSADFTLVSGPPGTGKTTFIAELVAQYLERHVGARVLVASQTHVALDNALERINLLSPGRKLLRVGRSERISQEVEELGFATQMTNWREEVLKSSRSFLRAYAAELGISVPDVDTIGLGNQLKALRKTVHDLRSRIQLRQAERRELVDELERLTGLTTDVLAMAEKVESAISAGSPDSLREAAMLFVEQGVNLAARLEAGGALQERLLEFETSLAQWRTELDGYLENEERLRRQLALGLGKSIDPLPSADELTELVASGGAIDHPQFNRLQEIYAEWEQRFGHGSEFNGALMASADVVAATCVGLAGVRGALDVTFDLCILDEASKATATEALVPMSRGRQWVVVGDQRQLPPFQEEALGDNALLERHGLSKSDLETTLFDVLSEQLPGENRYKLRLQHRMVPAIGSLISHCFYDGELESAPKAPLPAVSAVLEKPVSWLSTATSGHKFERRAGTSFVNITESHVIKKLLQNLNFAARMADGSLYVAVLSGYGAQRDQINRVLSDGISSWERLNVSVSTVDAYQGREADVAIFSVTRSNEERSLGFLRFKRRINVALSRGRYGLVIVGDDRFCSEAAVTDNPLRDVLAYMDRSESDCARSTADQ